MVSPWVSKLLSLRLEGCTLQRGQTVWVRLKTRSGSSLFRMQRQAAGISAANRQHCSTPPGTQRSAPDAPLHTRAVLSAKGQFRARSSKSLWYATKYLQLTGPSSLGTARTQQDPCQVQDFPNISTSFLIVSYLHYYPLVYTAEDILSEAA